MGNQVFQRYCDWLQAQEKICLYDAETQFSEKQWQSALYHGRFGSRWMTQEGEAVEVLHFGKWNRQEGPDFIGAVVKFDKQPPVRGDLELDHDVRDWVRHHHIENGAYRNVLVHFFFEKPAEHITFTRTLEGKCIPQVHLDLHQMQSSVTHLKTKLPIFSAVALDDILKLLETAARFRMRRKQDIFHRHVVFSGFSETLFQFLAAGLGYRSNSLPFHLLARRVGVHTASLPAGEAILFGMAGFLRGEEFMHVSQDAKKYLRSLWDSWWSYRDYFSSQELPFQLWKRTSVRPYNFPERRLGALVLIANQFSLLQELVQSRKNSHFVDSMKSFRHPFWQTHSSFFSAPHAERLLLGEERAQDLLINVFYPAQDIEEPRAWDEFQSITLPHVPQKIEEASSIFLGEKRLPQTRLREAGIQQGLLQLICHSNQFDFSS